MNLVAQIIGYLGTAFLVLSFQCKKESRLFLCQMLSGIMFVIHYGLLGDYTGMVMDGICFIRSFLMVSNNPKLTGKASMTVILVVIVALCVITWADIFSLFPTIALFVSTVFLFSGDGKKIRIAQISCTSPSWLIYNIYVHSVPGIICESFDMVSVLLYYIRGFIEKKKLNNK